MTLTRREVIDRLLCVLFPPRCVLCDEVVAYEDLWCGCGFRRCGDIVCEAPHRFSGAVAVAEYEGPVRTAILRLKERAEERDLRFFAGELAGLIAAAWPEAAFDAIIPVPTTAARLAERGFNQAERLAEGLAARLDLPVLAEALLRAEISEDQHSLTRAMRFENAARSYQAGDVAVEGLRLLLVDDVFTTGATAIACTEALLRAGAASVHVATAAATIERL